MTGGITIHPWMWERTGDRGHHYSPLDVGEDRGQGASLFTLGCGRGQGTSLFTIGCGRGLGTGGITSYPWMWEGTGDRGHHYSPLDVGGDSGYKLPTSRPIFVGSNLFCTFWIAKHCVMLCNFPYLSRFPSPWESHFLPPLFPLLYTSCPLFFWAPTCLVLLRLDEMLSHHRVTLQNLLRFPKWFFLVAIVSQRQRQCPKKQHNIVHRPGLKPLTLQLKVEFNNSRMNSVYLGRFGCPPPPPPSEVLGALLFALPNPTPSPLHPLPTPNQVRIKY